MKTQQENPLLTYGKHRKKTAAVRDGASGNIVAENNHLKAEQIDDFAARAKGCEARGDCGQIVKEMEDLSLKQQQEMIALCATNPKACKETYGDIPANGMLVREAIDRVLGADVPSQMKNDMSSLLAQQIEAEGVVTSTEFANQLKDRYGIDSQQAEILAGAALAAVTGGLGKAGKIPAVNPEIKIATGQTVGAFEKNLAFLSPRDRVSMVKETAPQVAAANGMVKDNKLTKLNNRDVYRGIDGNLYALDTQHGRFEVVTSKGKHLGEVDFAMQKIPNTIDKSGGHNLKVK